MRTRSILLRLGLVAALLALSACVTAQEVRGIVADSNAALTDQMALAQGVGILADTEVPIPSAIDPNAPAQPDTQQWRAKAHAAIGRIDAFVAKHSQNEKLARTVNALHLRKALLLAVSGDTNLARAAIAHFRRDLAGNARDLGLYHSHEALTWWWVVAANPRPPSASFKSAAKRHVAELANAITASPQGSAIRYYLATVRAHVQLKRANMQRDPRRDLKDALQAYCAQFDADAQAGVENWLRQDLEKLKTIPTEHLRSYGHAPIVLDMYTKTYQYFLDEWRAEPINAPNGVRQAIANGTLEQTPQWPDDCAWLTGT